MVHINGFSYGFVYRKTKNHLESYLLESIVLVEEESELAEITRPTNFCTGM